MVAHYAASGWLPLSEGDEGLIDLVAQGAQEGWAEVLPDRTEYRVLSSSDRRFELWLFAAFGQVRGAVPFIRGNVKWQVVIDTLLPRITGGMGAIKVHRIEEPDLTICMELPDYGRVGEGDIGTEFAAAVTGLAYLCRTVPLVEERYCIQRFYPYGMLNDTAVSAGEGSRCDVLACGRISRIDPQRNELTGLEVYLIDLDVNGMTMSVAAAPEMIEGDKPEVGRLFEGVFWMVGRFDRQQESTTLSRMLQRFTTF
jgi:hypothetical protein